MKRALVVVLLGACVGGRPTVAKNGGPTTTAGASSACPAARDTYVVQYSPGADEQARTWQMPLMMQALDAIDGTPVPYMKLDDATTRAAHIPPWPSKLWVYLNSEWCQATPAGAYRRFVDEGPISYSYGVELTVETKCAAPSGTSGQEHGYEYVAVAGDEAPTGCVVAEPHRVAARVGDGGDTGGDTWKPPATETPIPPSLASVLEPQPTESGFQCSGPGCQKLWTVGELDVGGKPAVYETVRSWVATTAEQPCSWEQRSRHEIDVMNGNGKLVSLAMKPQASDVNVLGVLVDDNAARVLVGTSIAEYATFTLDSTPPVEAHRIVYYAPNEEDYGGINWLGPYCGP